MRTLRVVNAFILCDIVKKASYWTVITIYVFLATYNEWMNAKIYNAIMYEFADELLKVRMTRLISAIRMLNHLIVVDTFMAETVCNPSGQLHRTESALSLPTPRKPRTNCSIISRISRIPTISGQNHLRMGPCHFQDRFGSPALL